MFSTGKSDFQKFRGSKTHGAREPISKILEDLASREELKNSGGAYPQGRYVTMFITAHSS